MSTKNRLTRATGGHAAVVARPELSTALPPAAGPADPLGALLAEYAAREAQIRQGGGKKGIERQHRHGRLTARERIELLCDREGIKGSRDQGIKGARSEVSLDPLIPRSLDPCFLELGLWAADGMYPDVGGVPAAGVITGIGRVMGRLCVIVANDATVKAGAFFPATCKKVLRAQRFCMDNKLPILYLVDSAGVYLPMQDEIFPDEDDFGRIFRHNAVISAMGVPQFAAIMGNCVAGGGYLPVMCDTLLMTEGSGLYLAGPALVKAAIGQVATGEEIGGALMHASISGTIDYREPNDELCIERLRRVVGKLGAGPGCPFDRQLPKPPKRPAEAVMDPILRACSPAALGRAGAPAATGINGEPAEGGRATGPAEGGRATGPAGGGRATGGAGASPAAAPNFAAAQYDVRELLDHLLDEGTFDEYKAEYGQSIVCGLARLDGWAVGVIANQKKQVKPAKGPLQFGSVIYVDSADKAARFILDCNQMRVPLIFLQDVNGFMVGRDSEQEGIIRSGAKLVNAVSNSVVPKITLITGGSFGAGNYAMCGKAYDPRFIFAWPTAKYAVMGAASAAKTILHVEVESLKRKGHEPDLAELKLLERKITEHYETSMDIRYAAARGWVDAIIAPSQTRRVLGLALEAVSRCGELAEFKTGVWQV
ncbi:putative propionyl-CoA carboxylase beta chain 5 [Phycisphaerae bacterium RAS1]|nr:putative propionyl-CoA carboxylase beta chain 5 [Phycisphaerae bacterium RAS1]